MRLCAFACVFAVAGTLRAQQAVRPRRAALADTVLADLSKLAGLERSYFAANQRYTDDIASLHYMPVSGAAIAVSYASARTFSASASHPRLAPFLCFVIVSDGGDSLPPVEKPFCTDSRYGTAAAALARGGADSESVYTPPVDSVRPKPRALTTSAARRKASKKSTPSVDSSHVRTGISPAEFAARLRTVTRRDSLVVLVQFAVNDARYDPSRGIFEVAIDRTPLPMTSDSGSARPALACFTQPAFVCGASGLTYIARDILHVSPDAAPGPDLLKAGLTLTARFAIGRRDNTPGPSLTLLALVLQSEGGVVARWKP